MPLHGNQAGYLLLINCVRKYDTMRLWMHTTHRPLDTTHRPLAAGYVLAALVAFIAAFGAEVSHRVDIPQEFTPDMSPDVWVNGYLPRFQRPVAGEPARVWMHDRKGQLVIRKTQIWFPDAYHIHPHAITASADGRSLLVSAEVWSRAGAATGVLCLVVAPGKVDNIIRTDDFLAEEVGLAGDGSIWTFGGPVVERFRRGGDYATVAWYSPAGLLQRALLPRSSFGIDYRPTKRGPEGGAAVVASRDRVGLYSSAASQWIEYDSEGNLIRRLQVSPPKAPDGTPMKLVRLAMTSHGLTYAWFYASASAARYGALCQLDPTAGTWAAVPEELLPAGFRGLFGSDGDQLILRSGPSLYGWYPPPDMLRQFQ